MVMVSMVMVSMVMVSMVMVSMAMMSRPKRMLQAPAPKARNGDVFDTRFQLAAEDWLDFLQREAHSRVYAKGEVILGQFSETDALFQIARGCVRLEKTTQLGDGTVVISRLGPPAPQQG